MHLNVFITQAKKQYPDCTINSPATINDIVLAQEKLNVIFPEQILDFYKTCNGIVFPEPFLEIYSLGQMCFIEKNSYLKFCVINKEEVICFDTSSLNEAGQWFIKGVSEDCTITYTMASFWSNKVWHWVKKRRPIWKTDKYQS